MNFPQDLCDLVWIPTTGLREDMSGFCAKEMIYWNCWVPKWELQWRKNGYKGLKDFTSELATFLLIYGKGFQSSSSCRSLTSIYTCTCFDFNDEEFKDVKLLRSLLKLSVFANNTTLLNMPVAISITQYFFFLSLYASLLVK